MADNSICLIGTIEFFCGRLHSMKKQWKLMPVFKLIDFHRNSTVEVEIYKFMIIYTVCVAIFAQSRGKKTITNTLVRDEAQINWWHFMKMICLNSFTSLLLVTYWWNLFLSNRKKEKSSQTLSTSIFQFFFSINLLIGNGALHRLIKIIKMT